MSSPQLHEASAMVCLPAMDSEYVMLGAANGAVSAPGDPFDLDGAIRDLLADPARASIQLPRTMSAEQRKHVKKMVEQHPSLKCESFGLGQERQMHVFKRADATSSDHINPDCSPQNVTVKNTFIDDWITPDGTPADGRIVQSMPHNMFAQSLSAEMVRHAPADVHEKKQENASSPVEQGTAAIAESNKDIIYELGSEVVINGLVKAPMFNGAKGVVQSWDADSKRYNISLNIATPCGHRLAKVKGENLRHALPKQHISFGCFDQ